MRRQRLTAHWLVEAKDLLRSDTFRRVAAYAVSLLDARPPRPGVEHPLPLARQPPRRHRPVYPRFRVEPMARHSAAIDAAGLKVPRSSQTRELVRPSYARKRIG